MSHTMPLLTHTNFNKKFHPLTRSAKSLALLVCAVLALSAFGFAQSGTMSTYAGLNSTIKGSNASAAPDVTIAVGTLEYCEHVNSEYQCWYKGGANANQPVNFLGSTSPKSDAGPWSQNSNNGGNTPNCPTAFSPNSQMLHDNVYDLWIMEKRITSKLNGNNYMCVAIGNVEDVSSTSPAFAWFAFEYDLDLVIPLNSHGNYYYPDYPQTGLWQDSTSTTPPYTAATDQAMWITYDLQDPNNSDNVMGVLVCAVDLAGLRASTSSPYRNNSHTPACAVAHPLVTYTQRRSWVPANNSDTTPPISNDGEMFTYMIEPPENKSSYLTDPNHTQGVEQWTIDWAATTPTPTFVNSWDLPSTQPNGDQLGCFNPLNYYGTVCVPQPSTSTTGIYIDSVADRMQQFFHYTSDAGQGSVWTSAHAIQIVPNATSFTQTEADLRILQRNTAYPNAVYIAGDYPILDPVDPNAYVVLPSIARDKVGNLQGILGISGSGSNEHPGLDSLNFIPGTLTSGTYGYIASPLTDGDAEDTDTLGYRWGDWYSAVLDPSDGCTVWVAGEYLPVNRTYEPYWYTEMAKLPPMNSCLGPVTLSSVSLNFGNIQVGVQSPPIVITVTNNQTVALNISGISTGGGVFTQTNTCQQPLAPNGGTCTISVSFTPTATGTATGTLTVTDGASNSPQTASLTGIGATSAISLSPGTLAFGNQVLNLASTGQAITVTNSGFINLTVNSVVASGGYSQTSNCSGATLTPGQTCTITVTFAPTIVGSMPGAITVNDTAVGAPHVVGLTGSGILALSMSNNLTFAATNVGSTSVAQTMTLTNNQSQSVTFTWATSGDFSAVGNNSSPCNGTLAAKAKCTFAVSFTPTTNGVTKGNLTITPTPSGNIVAGGLTGTGQNGASSPLTFTPASVSFGNVGITTSSVKTTTIKNVSSATIDISSVTGSGYFVVTPSGTTPCGGNLLAGKSCTVTVTFTPLVTGSILGGVTVIDNASIGTQVQNATGTGLLDIALTPTSINFGSVNVGSTSAVSVITVTNNLPTAVPINSVVASGDFISTAGGGIPCGTSVLANSTCTLGVQFSPSVTGAISGALTVSYGAGSSPQVVSLSGTGSSSSKSD
ncbi:MAG: choice-of-anchor D domain-containing protein [Candidatus Sulfotelmatobacter sp.]